MTATNEILEENEGVPLRSKIGLWLGPAVFLSMLLFVELDPSNPLVTRMAAVILCLFDQKHDRLNSYSALLRSLAIIREWAIQR